MGGEKGIKIVKGGRGKIEVRRGKPRAHVEAEIDRHRWTDQSRKSSQSFKGGEGDTRGKIGEREARRATHLVVSMALEWQERKQLSLLRTYANAVIEQVKTICAYEEGNQCVAAGR